MEKIQIATNYNIFQIPGGGGIVDWFGRYETADPIMTWAEVQHAFIIRFNAIRNERQCISVS